MDLQSEVTRLMSLPRFTPKMVEDLTRTDHRIRLAICVWEEWIYGLKK